MLRLTLILFAVALFTSCKQRKDPSYLQSISASLRASNESLVEYNRSIYGDMVGKTRDPHTATSASLWEPRAGKLHELSTEIIKYIRSFKYDTLNEKNAQHLKQRLSDYKQQIADVFSSDGFEYRSFADRPDYRESIRRDSIEILKDLPLLSSKDEQIWSDSTLKYANLELTRVILYTIENNVLVSENKILRNMLDHCTLHVTGPCDWVGAIAQLNSSYVKSGDVIEVTAGMISYRVDASPIITINGKQITLNADGGATYSFRARKKPGKYFVPVQIDYTKPDGAKERIIKHCYYTVAQ